MKLSGIFIILLAAGFLLCGCSKSEMPSPEAPEGVSLMLTAVRAASSASDLPTEYAINNLSIFLTAPGSATVTNSFVNQAFSSKNDTSLINLASIDPSTIGNKDVYVIANCPNTAALNAVAIVADIQALRTPAAPISITGGLPMYGQTSNVNLGATSAATPAAVALTRTCAKLLVTLTFTSSTYTGTDNTFTVQNAAPYTFYVYNSTHTFASADLINYSPVTMEATTVDRQFQGTAYIYESNLLPRLQISTNIDGVDKTYVASSQFPLPVRNYLYDIQIEVLPSQQSQAGLTGFLSFSVYPTVLPPARK